MFVCLAFMVLHFILKAKFNPFFNTLSKTVNVRVRTLKKQVILKLHNFLPMYIKVRLEKDYSVKLTFTRYNCIERMTLAFRGIILEMKERFRHSILCG